MDTDMQANALRTFTRASKRTRDLSIESATDSVGHGSTVSGEPSSSLRRGFITASVLAGLYILGTYLLMRLEGPVTYPFDLPDEAEYVITAHNIFTMHQFSFEGLFPALIPPLYPIAIAIGQALGGGSVTSPVPLVLNHLIMTSVIFPSYILARQLRLSRVAAVLSALASMWVPFMWMAGHFMAEVLYYPLFVWCFVAVLAYFQRTTSWRAIIAGAVIGISLCSKNTGAAIVLTWALTCGIVLLTYLVQQRPSVRTFLRSAVLRSYAIFPILGAIAVGLIYGPWVIYRAQALRACTGCVSGASSVVGESSTFLKAITDQAALRHFLPLYAVDMFLSVGILILPLVIVALVSLGRGSMLEKSQAMFLGIAIVIVIIMAAAFSGYTSDQLRERHMFVLTPLFLALAGRGLAALRAQPRWRLLPTFLAASLAEIWLLAHVGFGTNVYGVYFIFTSWAYGLGSVATSIAKVHAVGGWDVHVFYEALLILAIGSQVIWLLRASWRAPVLFASTCLMFIVMLVPVLNAISQGEEANIQDQYVGSGGLATWLNSQVGSGQRLLFYGCDRFSPACRTKDPVLTGDNGLYAWGDNYLDLYYVEAATWDDMTPVPNIAQLPQIAATSHASYLISPVALTGLPSLGHYGITELYDLRTYQLHPLSSDAVALDPSPGCYAEDIQPVKAPNAVHAGASFQVTVTVRNMSACTWTGGGSQRTWISYRWRNPSGAVIGSFINPPMALPSDVPPGKTVTVSVPVYGTPAAGDATLEIDLVVWPGAGSFEQEGGQPLRIPMTIH